MGTLTIRLDDKLERELNQLAKKQRRTTARCFMGNAIHPLVFRIAACGVNVVNELAFLMNQSATARTINPMVERRKRDGIEIAHGGHSVRGIAGVAPAGDETNLEADFTNSAFHSGNACGEYSVD